jgi:hypothetical protein
MDLIYILCLIRNLSRLPAGLSIRQLCTSLMDMQLVWDPLWVPMAYKITPLL